MTDPPVGKNVVGVGLACLDHLILWRDMTRPVLDNKVLAFDVQGGGMAATAMVAVARLGGRAEFWGAVGGDWAGELIVKQLQAEGVDTRHVRRIEGKSGPLVVVCIHQPTGQRHFLYGTGVGDSPEPLGDLADLRTAGCLLTDRQARATAIRAAREARRLGVPVVGDVEGIPAGRCELLSCMDYAIASAECAGPAGADSSHENLREACRVVKDMGPGCVVITLGGKGLVWYDGDQFGRMPAWDVDVVDTTGAGDVFHGAFCRGLVGGLDLEANLAFSSAVAAIKCGHVGGRAGIPTRGQAVEFLATRGVKLNFADAPEGPKS